MQHAWPLDELNPLACCGRGEHLPTDCYYQIFPGPDVENPDNININDVLGDFSLTLIDSLDTLAGLNSESGVCSEYKLNCKINSTNRGTFSNSVRQIILMVSMVQGV